MSRPTYDPKQTYTGTGSLAAYSFDFKITSLTQLLVIEVNALGVETQRVRGDDTAYLSGVVYDAVDGGGTVTLDANLPSGYNLILLLADDAPVQDYPFRNKTSFQLRRFEDALDNVMGAVQRLVYKGKQAFRIHDLDDEETFNTQLPPGIADQASRVFQVNSTADGFEFGPTTTEIANAQGYAEAAADSAQEADASAEVAEDGAETASLILFDGELSIAIADSPVTLTAATYTSKIVRIDATLGNIIINLDAIASYPAFYKTQFIRSDSEAANTVTIIPNGAETIDLAASYLLPLGSAVIISPSQTVPTNWVKKFIGVTAGGSSLPTGGIDADYLEIQGGAAAFESGIFAGFSSRYGVAWNTSGLRATLLAILDFSYLAPQISLSCSPAQSVREKGTVVAAVTMTATTTKRSDPITTVTHWRNGVLVDTEASPSATGGAETFTESTPFSDTMTFFSRVGDGTSTIQSNTVTYTYVYPYYSGAAAPGRTPAQVAALTKDVRVSTASLNKTFTPANGDVYYYAYPASYGALTSIKDENNFETFGDWTLTTANITGLDASAVSYRIYAFNNPVVAGSTNYTFIR
jgi:hypothetical protein